MKHYIDMESVSLMSLMSLQEKETWLAQTCQVRIMWSRQMQMWRHWHIVTCSTSVWKV